MNDYTYMLYNFLVNALKQRYKTQTTKRVYVQDSGGGGGGGGEVGVRRYENWKTTTSLVLKCCNSRGYETVLH